MTYPEYSLSLNWNRLFNIFFNSQVPMNCCIIGLTNIKDRSRIINNKKGEEKESNRPELAQQIFQILG